MTARISSHFFLSPNGVFSRWLNAALSIALILSSLTPYVANSLGAGRLDLRSHVSDVADSPQELPVFVSSYGSPLMALPVSKTEIQGRAEFQFPSMPEFRGQARVKSVPKFHLAMDDRSLRESLLSQKNIGTLRVIRI